MKEPLGLSSETELLYDTSEGVVMESRYDKMKARCV